MKSSESTTLKAVDLALDFDYTPVFEWNLEAESRYVVNQGGTWSSKTYSLMQVLPLKTYMDVGSTTTIVGQDIPHLRDGPVDDFMKVWESSQFIDSLIAGYNKSLFEVRFKNGSMLHFKAYSDAQDAKSGKRDRLFLNEANGISYDIFNMLNDRTRKQTYIDYNPDVRFWVHDEIIPKDDAVLFISNCFEHNEHCPDAVKKRILERCERDQNYKKVYAFGVTGKIEGLVFKHVYTTKAFPEQAEKVAYALDFGFSNDVTALVKLGTKHGHLYGQELIYETGMTNKDISDRLKALGIKKTARIVADSSEPKSIAELKGYGWNIIPAKKGADSVRFGIDMINTYDLYLTQDSKNWIEESEKYKYKKDRNGKWLNQPIDRFNHCFDAARYYAVKILKRKQKMSGRRIGILQ